MKFTHYAEGNDWEFETSCIKDTDRIREFTAEEQKIAAKFVSLDVLRRKDEEKIQQGLWKPTVHFDKEKDGVEIDLKNDPPAAKGVAKEP